jgi:cell division protein FtsB
MRRGDLWLLVASVVILGSLISLFALRGVRIHTLRHQLEASQLGYDEAMAERQVLEDQLALKDNIDAIEDAAREKLGWVLPGEERVIFIDPAGSSEGEGE